MSELQVIEQTLVRAARRRRTARAHRGLWLGLLAGGGCALLLVGAHILLPLPTGILIGAALSPLAGMGLGAMLGGWRRLTLAETARWVDQQTHLKERLSTAWELAAGPERSEWEKLVIADAAAHAQEVDARRLVRLSLPRASRWTLLVLMLAAGLGFVPEYRSKAYLQRQADQQNIQDVGRRLGELTRRNLDQRPPAMEPARESLEAVAEVANRLEKATLTRAEALKDLANVAEKLKEQLSDLSKDPGLKRLEEAARSGGSGGQSQTGAQKQMEALQQKLGSNPPAPGKLDDLRRKLENLQSVARAMANDSSAASAAERERASQSLSELSREAQSLGVPLPDLDAAMEALAANQTDLFLKEMELALRDLDQLREMARTLQQLQQAGQPPGKDLAEQLEKGQAEAAAATLRSMAKQLRQANLSAEELKNLLAEVQKALGPAANYGQVAKSLQAGAANLSAGAPVPAGENLEQAARELERLLDQMADAQTMMAQLSALQQASICVGTGQGWAACRAAGSKPGGKPGAGVGTWADEGAEWAGDMTDRWDNSGVVRPDTAPRGLTERQATDPGDALKPTRVKGQFSPGGEMPSIALKGVSIRGQSTVDYRAAAAAAQTEADSALSQEKVPKMYQGTVREYFDELKK
jgi:hypothetical protein